jgi:hypothetical protein
MWMYEAQHSLRIDKCHKGIKDTGLAIGDCISRKRQFHFSGWIFKNSRHLRDYQLNP